MGNFHAVGAIVPKTLSARRWGTDFSTVSNLTPVVHCGGLFSPVMCNGADVEFVQQVFETLECFQTPVRIVLPEHLCKRFGRNPRTHLSVVECSPNTVSEHLVGSPFALTTSGIEFTYESMILGVPTFFLPPFNFTQCMQLRYHRRVFDGCVQFSLPEEQCQSDVPSLDDATESVQAKGMLGNWKAQFNSLAQFLCRFFSEGGQPWLEALGLAQGEAIRKVLRDDGARTIASFVVRELIAQGKVECVSLSM